MEVLDLKNHSNQAEGSGCLDEYKVHSVLEVSRGAFEQVIRTNMILGACWAQNGNTRGHDTFIIILLTEVSDGAAKASSDELSEHDSESVAEV